MNWLVEKIERLINSFDTKNDGFSGRKISSFCGVIVAAYITKCWCNSEILQDILAIWLVFVAFCLGLVTASQIISFKNGSSENNNTD